jgi:hypothetical protein
MNVGLFGIFRADQFTLKPLFIGGKKGLIKED